MGAGDDFSLERYRRPKNGAHDDSLFCRQPDATQIVCNPCGSRTAVRLYSISVRSHTTNGDGIQFTLKYTIYFRLSSSSVSNSILFCYYVDCESLRYYSKNTRITYIFFNTTVTEKISFLIFANISPSIWCSRFLQI